MSASSKVVRAVVAVVALSGVAASSVGVAPVTHREGIAKPVAARYAWAANPSGCNLYNREGLPASPFRTDDWPGMTVDAG